MSYTRRLLEVVVMIVITGSITTGVVLVLALLFGGDLYSATFLILASPVGLVVANFLEIRRRRRGRLF